MSDKKCTHQSTNIKGVQCVTCTFSNTGPRESAIKEFLKLVKYERFKETKPYIKELESLSRVGPRVARVLNMKLVDGLTYKQIGEDMGFSSTRARQLYCKGIDIIEMASNKKQDE